MIRFIHVLRRFVRETMEIERGMRICRVNVMLDRVLGRTEGFGGGGADEEDEDEDRRSNVSKSS